MTEHERSLEADESSHRARHLAYGVGSVKLIFVLALLRLFATPMTKDLLGEEVLPMPTWEWSLFSVTPGILICFSLHTEDWHRLRDELTIIRWALGFYLVYGLAFAVLQGAQVLWIAVLAGLGGLVGIWHLNRRELSHAR
ncbi:hypothetical protein ACIO93_30375 [Streptomyces sp. NPDC087903]|uniref:hypothetical protein n=1 Tax=Streptomyces sp. NPDC087903 TaxID=3365819 RepID=UPI0037F4E06C